MPLALTDDADLRRDGAARLDLDDRGVVARSGNARRLVELRAVGVRLDVRGDADADDPPGRARRHLLASPVLVVERGQRALQRVAWVDRAIGQLGRRPVRQVAIGEHVAAPDVDGIEVERTRHRVDRAFRHPATDQHRRAVRPRGALVRQDGRDRVAIVAQPVGAGDHHADDARHVVRGEIRVGAEVGEDLHVEAEDRAVRLHRGAHIDDVLARVERGEQILAAGLDPAHGAAEEP